MSFFFMLSSWSAFCLVEEVSCWASALLRLPTFLCSGGLRFHHSNTRATQRVSPLSQSRCANRDLKCSYKTVIPYSQNLFPWNIAMFIHSCKLCFLSSAYNELCSQISSPTFMGADSFYVRVNLSIEPLDDPPSLGVSCDDIIHVTDTRYNGKYHWRCSLVDPRTAKHLQAGTMPNYNRCAN